MIMSNFNENNWSIILLPFFLTLSGSVHGGQVCFPFENQVVPTENPLSIQGRPGKIGPVGPPGPEGGIGVPGVCGCDPNEIEQLRREIESRDVTIATIRSVLRTTQNRAVLCGVGLKDGRVRDENIAVSSTYHPNYAAKNGRLDQQGVTGAHGGWLGCRQCTTTCTNDCKAPGEWIQVDLSTPTRVVAVVTQGFNYAGAALEWATSYKISYGNSTSSLQVIENNDGSEIMFNGNTDRETHVTNEFPSPITARYFRLIVQSYHNWGVVRHEYLTC